MKIIRSVKDFQVGDRVKWTDSGLDITMVTHGNWAAAKSHSWIDYGTIYRVGRIDDDQLGLGAATLDADKDWFAVLPHTWKRAGKTGGRLMRREQLTLVRRFKQVPPTPPLNS